MGFKSIAKIVRKGSSSPPNEADPEHAQRKQQDKLQKEHDKHVAREKGKKVLPTNPEQEAEYRELNARMWRIEKDMQDARDEVMKPRMKENVMESRLSMSSFQREPLFVPERLSTPSTAGSNSTPSTPGVQPAMPLRAEPSYFPAISAVPALPPSMPSAQPSRTPSPLSQYAPSTATGGYIIHQAPAATSHSRTPSSLRNQHFPEGYTS